MRLLLVEDKKVLCSTLKKLFEKENIDLDISYDGVEGLALALAGSYSVIILDIMLPLLSGVEIVKKLRAKSILTPVLMLTALDTVHDKVSALDYGADDYIVKPFDNFELLARVRALARRSPSIRKELATVGNTSVDLITLEVKIGTKVVKTTRKETLILASLFQSAGEFVQKDDILQILCGLNRDITSNNAEVYIYNLRKKFSPELSGFRIETKHSFGYRVVET